MAMQLGGLLSSMLCFVTDCDGTLCHYTSASSEPSEPSQLSEPSEPSEVRLPPSAGSGAVAIMSTDTQTLLAEIAAHPSISAVVCASGMRLATALQRVPFLPAVRYWILENGGLVLERDAEGGLVELEEWRASRVSAEATAEALRQVALSAASEGLRVDAAYATMLRVKGPAAQLHALADRLPASLGLSFNLGHLDVYAAGGGKLAAVRWLLRRLRLDDRAFLYMGDDDNDVEAAAAALRAFVTMPCSADMRAALLTGRVKGEAAGAQGVRGTEQMLRAVLATLDQSSPSV